MNPLWREGPSEQLDEDVVRAAKGGSPRAVVKLLTAVRPWLYTYIRTQVHPNQVEDLVQDVSVEIIRALSKLKPGELPHPIVPWVREIARTTLLDLHRRIAARPEVIVALERLLEIPDPGSPPADQVALDTALQSLPEEYRDLLVRRHVLGEQLDEIAVELDLPRTTLVRRLEWAESEFRNRLGDVDE